MAMLSPSAALPSVFAENQPFPHGKLPKMQCFSNMYCYSRFQGSFGWFFQWGLTRLTSMMSRGPGLSWVETVRLEISRQGLSWCGSPQPHGSHSLCEASLGFFPGGLGGSESSKTGQAAYLWTAHDRLLEEIKAHDQLEATLEGWPRGMNAGRLCRSCVANSLAQLCYPSHLEACSQAPSLAWKAQWLGSGWPLGSSLLPVCLLIRYPHPHSNILDHFKHALLFRAVQRNRTNRVCMHIERHSSWGHGSYDCRGGQVQNLRVDYSLETQGRAEVSAQAHRLAFLFLEGPVFFSQNLNRLHEAHS